MNHEHSTASLSPVINEMFRKMIDEAPPEAESLAAEEKSGRCLVRQAHGWGAKYVEEIELHGDRWMEVYTQAKNIVAARGIVALLGLRGTGKTRMAAEITRAGYFPSDHGEWNGNGVVRNKTSRYIRTLDLFLDLRDAANSKTTSEKRILQELERPGLLVMDEFHERGNTEWENRIVANLIDKRYSTRRPSIIIANFSPEEMTTALGPSVVDRMRENGKAFICDWESYRNPAQSPSNQPHH